MIPSRYKGRIYGVLNKNHPLRKRKNNKKNNHIYIKNYIPDPHPFREPLPDLVSKKSTLDGHARVFDKHKGYIVKDNTEYQETDELPQLVILILSFGLVILFRFLIKLATS